MAMREQPPLPTPNELRALRRRLLLDHRVSSQPVRLARRGTTIRLRGTVQSHRRKLLAGQIVRRAVDDRRVIRNEIAVALPQIDDDAKIAEAVRAALARRDAIPDNAITVAVEAGIATLQGHVASHDELILAQDIALGVPGVRRVHNMLGVDLCAEVSDTAFAREAETALTNARGLRDARLRVGFDGTKVVLSGTVPTKWQREVAAAIIARMGVLRLENQIRVTT